MLKQSDAFNQAFAGDTRVLSLKLIVNDKTTFTAEDVVSLEYDSAAFTGDAFGIGSTFENTIKIVFADLQEGLKQNDVLKPQVGIQLSDGTFEYAPLGVFIISDEIQQDRNAEQTTLTAVDKMAYLEGTYVPIDGINKHSVKDLVLEIANAAGVSVNTNNVERLPATNDIAPIVGQTYRNALGMLAQFIAGYVTFNRSGELELRSLSDDTFAIAPENYEFQGLTKNESVYNLSGISCSVTTTVLGDDASASDTTATLQSGVTTGSQVALTNNSMTQDLLDNVFNMVKGLSFYPYTLNWFGNPAVEAGDWLKIQDTKGNTFLTLNNSYVLTFDGSLSAVSSTSETVTNESGYSYQGTLHQVINDIQGHLAAGGGNYVFTGTETPTNPKENDVWYKDVNGKTEMYIYENGEWILKASDVSGEEAANIANEAAQNAQDAKNKADDAYNSAADAFKTAESANDSVGVLKDTVAGKANESTVEQIDSAWRVAIANSGSSNYVYNSSYANKAEGWNLFGKAYLSTAAVSTGSGSPGFAVNYNGTYTGGLEFGESKHLPLISTDVDATYNAYSAQVTLKIYADSTSDASVGATVAYYNDAGTRIGNKDIQVPLSSAKEAWVTSTIEDVAVVSGAKYVGIQYWLRGTHVHAIMINPIINHGKSSVAYHPDTASQTDILATIDDIQMRVSNADGTTSIFDMNGNTILLDSNKIILNGSVSIKSGTIGDAQIGNLSASKLTAGTIDAATINLINLNANNITTGTISGANLSINLSTGTVTFQKGRIHSADNGIDINIDSKYVSVADSSSRVLLQGGQLQFTDPNIFSLRASPYFAIQNAVTGGSFSTSSLIGRNFIAMYNSANPPSILDMGQETFAGISAGQNDDGTWSQTRVGGADRGVVMVGGTPMDSIVSLWKDSPSIRVGTDGKGNSRGNRVELRGNYVHATSIYTRTASSSANVYVAADGALVRSSSASKYKINISDFNDSELAHALLNIKAKTWYDKAETESIVDEMTNGMADSFGTPQLNPYLGFIAEDLAYAGLEMLVERGADGQLEGINYDRISALEHLNVQELFRRVLELEKEVYELRSDNH